MSVIKPEMDASTAKEFLENCLGGTVKDLQPATQGQVSRVYFFHRAGADYVVHFNHHGEGYERERFLSEKLTPQGIPVPRVVQTGAVDGLFFSIAERACGLDLMNYREEQIKGVLGHLVELFFRINQLNLQETTGFGPLNAVGNGENDSWAESLEWVFREDLPGFWHGWHGLFETSFMERDLFDQLFAKMLKLAEYCPEKRYLVHGDFHLGNLISDGQTITGIVDWEMASYGDFAFDLANMDLWTPSLQFTKLFYHYSQRMGVAIPHLEERLGAGLLRKGLDGMRFYARTDNQNGYNFVKNAMQSYVQNKLS